MSTSKLLNFRALCLLAIVMLGSTVFAQPTLFKDADLKLGVQLIAEKNCDSCHQKREEVTAVAAVLNRDHYKFK